MNTAQVQQTADVDERATLGAGTTVWHLAQIRENARLGTGCVVGRGAYIGPGVIIGSNVKLQNYALVYEPATLEDDVFIGPAVVLTNDLYPRSVDVAGKLKRPEDWDALGVIVRRGASLGARAVVVAGCVIGRWALVAAGAVVTRDVPDFALVAGVPARRIGWVGRGGRRLAEIGFGRWKCPQTGEIYDEMDGILVPATAERPQQAQDNTTNLWPLVGVTRADGGRRGKVPERPTGVCDWKLLRDQVRSQRCFVPLPLSSSGSLSQYPHGRRPTQAHWFTNVCQCWQHLLASHDPGQLDQISDG